MGVYVYWRSDGEGGTHHPKGVRYEVDHNNHLVVFNKHGGEVARWSQWAGASLAKEK